MCSSDLGGGAFHQRSGDDASGEIRDSSRPGVAELTSAVAQLQALAEEIGRASCRERV